MARGRPLNSDGQTVLLTEVELVLMQVIWRLEMATVKDVVAALPSDEARKITTVATFLKIMETKGFVTSSKQDRSLVYRPEVRRSDYQVLAIRSLCDALFDGCRAKMVETCLDEFEIDRAALESLSNMTETRAERLD